MYLPAQKAICPFLFTIIGLSAPLGVWASEKLSGTPIGTVDGFDYEHNRVVKNIQGRAFDGNLNTYFATNERSYTWVGLDLGTPHVISRVGWSPRDDWHGAQRVQLGVIQGANREDFLDAVPIYMITEEGVIGEMSYGDVNCSKGFRYVRFVSTSDARCNIAELEFYGTEGEGSDSGYFSLTSLPTVCINTVDAAEPYDKEHNISCNVIIIHDGEIDTDAAASVRERGNYSRTFPKKPWRIKFDKKQNVLDAPAKAKKWTLINNYGDKTLMRNLLAFEIGRRFEMPYVPWGRAVDVILNGEYKGCYQLCDQVEVNPGRLDITEMEPEDVSGDALTGGYFIEVDAYAYDEPEGEWFASAYHSIPVTIKSPDDGGTKEQYDYIRNYFSNLENMVFSNQFGANGKDYRDIFDVDSFIRHMLVGELSGNTDTYWSTYMYKDRGDDVIHTGPIWDFDIAFENDNRTYPIHTRVGKNRYLFETEMASAANGMADFARRIVKSDSRSKEDIKRIWSIARNDNHLSAKEMNEYVDALAEMLDEPQKLNFLRWPIMNQMVHQNPVISGNYKREVERVKSYLKDRFSDLDKLIGYDSSISAVEGITSEEASIIKDIRVSGNMISSLACNPFAVYSVSGALVYSGADTTSALPSGIYIVKTVKGSMKVVI